MTTDTPFNTLINHFSALIDGSAEKFDQYLASHALSQLGDISREDGLRLADVSYKALLAQTEPEVVADIANLLEKVIQFFTYDDILALDPPIDLAQGLTLPFEPFRALVISILESAAKSVSSTRALAKDSPDVLRELIKFWLTTDSVGQAERAGRVLVRMLRNDLETTGIDDGIDRISISPCLPSGPVWSAIFANEDTFSLIIKACQEGRKGEKPSRADASIARGRLLDWIPEVAKLNWFAVSQNPFEKSEDIETPELKKFTGLVPFGMQDIGNDDDPLSFLVAIKCLVGLLRLREEGPPEAEKGSLGLFKRLGIHDKLISIYTADTTPDSLEAQLVLPAAADYFANYLRQYPDLFIGPKAQTSESRLLSKTLEAISKAVNIQASHWPLLSQVNQSSPQLSKLVLHLDVLQAVPRSALLNKPVPGYPPRAMSVLLKIPVTAESPEALNTLANIFHGATSAVPGELMGGLTGEPSRFIDAQTEATASRDLYQAYITRHPSAWTAVIEHANRSLSNKNMVFAAIHFIQSIITAQWKDLAHSAENPTAPVTGSLAILAPGTFEKVVPYLLQRSPSNAQTVAGSGPLRMDDPDHHALYELVNRRFDLLKLFKAALERDAAKFPAASGTAAPVGASRIGPVLKQINDRIRQGPWNTAKEGRNTVSVATEAAA